MFLPAGILEYFDITGASQKGEQMTLCLEEKNELPEPYRDQPFHSKGFLPAVLIEDFPIRGNKVLLQIKRRRWEHQQSGQIISRDWQLVQKGTKMTAEFAAFLKQVFG
ncbi:MAG: transposase [Chitinophagaceae bacterium]|nr:MAG: transposase [Chitinophagaceae bacterium]